ncbi:hypothetical protein LTR66_003602 [Elasticomyces elasticus]|nr:hypothetical protein LTR66_003602 [Elasticomyces elasticus]
MPNVYITASSNASDEYLIWPREPTNPSRVEETGTAIRQILGPNATIQKTILDKDVVTFWYTALSQSQAEQIGKLDGVLEVQQDVLEDIGCLTDPE